MWDQGPLLGIRGFMDNERIMNAYLRSLQSGYQMSRLIEVASESFGIELEEGNMRNNNNNNNNNNNRRFVHAQNARSCDEFLNACLRVGNIYVDFLTILQYYHIVLSYSTII